jgi:hypothetical protein
LNLLNYIIIARHHILLLPLHLQNLQPYSAPNKLRQQFKISYFERVKLNQQFGVKNMSKKRTNYNSAFKTKLVLELLQK